MTKSIRSIIFRNQEWVIILLLSLLVVGLRWPSLEQPFDNDSGANAYHARLIVRGEPLYSTHHPVHHMPGVYYTYALAFLLFGDSLWSVKFLLIPWTVVTAYILYRLGYSLLGQGAGLLTAIFYVILSAHVQLAGTTAETELFANLPRTAAILVLVRLFQQQAADWKFVVAGVVSAVAFLFKAVYLTPLAIAGFLLLMELWQNRKRPSVWQTSVKRGVWIGAGFILALIPVILYFGLAGVLPRFFNVFAYGQDYVNYRIAVSELYPPEYRNYWPLFPIYGLVQTNIVFLIYGLMGLLFIVFGRLKNKSLSIIGIVIWAILSILQTSLTRVLFYHYYLLIVPPLALLAAYPLATIYHFIRSKAPIFNRFTATLVFLVLLVIPLWFSVTTEKNLNFYRHYVRYKLGQETFDDFLVRGSPQEGPKLLQVQHIANYIKERTSLSDYVYYWTGNAQFYYLADRRSPIDVIWPIYAEITGSYKRIFVPETKYVIVGKDNNVTHYPDWLFAEIDNYYTLEIEIEGQKIYRRSE